MKTNILFVLLLANMLFSTSLFAQKRVTGTVTDADTHQPISGVAVIINGTVNGELTDSAGNYAINVPSDDTILLYVYIGYHTEDRVVGGRTVIDVEMSEDIDEENEGSLPQKESRTPQKE